MEKLFKFKRPFANELNLRFWIINHNEVSGKCQIKLATELPGINPALSPIETVDFEDLEEVSQ